MIVSLRGCVALLTLLVSGPAVAETSDTRRDFVSGEHRVALIELFTSEGCSSCPPADRWLSELRADPDLWKRFTPIGYHVDYWDYIGWKDRFAHSDYSVRQRQYAAEGGVRVVYTPGVFSDGQEWRGWQNGDEARRGGARVGNLRVRVDDDVVAVHFAADTDDDADLIAHVALLGMGLETQVRAGENRGRTLRHDFVALGVTSARLEPGTDGYAATMRLPKASVDARDKALVAWVSAAGAQTPVQSVGGYLPGS